VQQLQWMCFVRLKYSVLQLCAALILLPLCSFNIAMCVVLGSFNAGQLQLDYKRQ
jgi:hypothetical protein